MFSKITSLSLFGPESKPSKPKEDPKVKQYKAMMKKATLALTKVALLPGKVELRSHQFEELAAATSSLFHYVASINSSNQVYNSAFIESMITKINALDGPLDKFLVKCQNLLQVLSKTNSNLEYNSDVKHKFDEAPFRKNLTSYSLTNLPNYLNSMSKKLNILNEIVKAKKKYIDSFNSSKHPARFNKIHDIITDVIEKLQKELSVVLEDKGNYVPPDEKSVVEFKL
jgi:hypothetical protein